MHIPFVISFRSYSNGCRNGNVDMTLLGRCSGKHFYIYNGSQRLIFDCITTNSVRLNRMLRHDQPQSYPNRFVKWMVMIQEQMTKLLPQLEALGCKESLRHEYFFNDRGDMSLSSS